MSKPIDLLRRELHAFCDLAQRRGWSLSTRDGYVTFTSKTCCPIGAASVVIDGCKLHKVGESVMSVFAGELLFDSIQDANDFALGFDGCIANGPYADLGREFRAHYCAEDAR